MSRHKAAYCRRLDGPIAFKMKLDYLIVVGHQNFMKVKPFEKACIVVHELNHIKQGERNGEPAIREHDGDFCEIPEHDKFSREIVARIIDHLPTLSKIPYQTTLEEQGKLA